MKNVILYGSLSCLLVLAGCSSPSQREKVSGSYDYLKTKQLTDGFEVPTDLQQPLRSNQYDLPILESANEDAEALVGQNMRISSPRLILPLVSGSNVIEGSEDAVVTFDKINDREALDKTIWDKVLGYLEKNNIGVENFDRENNVLTTDWVVSRTEIPADSWYDFTSEFIEESRKFTLSLELAPHGRIASLSNEIVAYIDQDGNSALNSLDAISERSDEVEFLNYIIAEYDFGIRLARSERIAKIRDGFSTELGFNADGDSAYIINAGYNNAWPRLLLVLRKMGFDVIDLDQSSGLLFVAYNGNDDGWFSGLFSDEELPLEKDNYRILVQRSGERTSVTFKDDENISFDIQLVTDLFPIFQEYMASDNLDI
ncbi:outer membrane protein assembly factor BamC [Glaciecola petra]|uniref:Outer membrane protein assembly factor BamC n=1 Tax=Glaciecola petra TaxID=3075602 RepID=A0ABU2ZQH1_9ALTE|nr:outer membrane protein assembly factor BamC [Aestuariibacter sp. P117]MDT0594293.1 outer membrane protein assembly factor BamC [Aestuariibacter sp. P117]